MSGVISKKRKTDPKSGQEEFEKMVADGIAAIPQRFLQKLDNVAIVIEDEPTTVQKRKLRLNRRWAIFGLYEGVPQTTRGAHYGSVLPDKITIFRKPIMRAAQDIQAVRAIVKDTVWHEIAHHFGMNEYEVRRSEARRKNKKSRSDLD